MQPPRIIIRLDLSAPTFYFSNPIPLTLTVGLILSATSQPITIDIPYGSPLDMGPNMAHGAFPITDLTSSPPKSVVINDLTGTVARMADVGKRVYLQPGKAYAMSVAFTRGGSYESRFRPQPWDIVKRGVVLDENGAELNLRRPSQAAGLDGLEAGKRYRATVAVEKLSEIEWWWSREDEAESSQSVPATTENPLRSNREPEETPLAWDVENDGVEFSVET